MEMPRVLAPERAARQIGGKQKHLGAKKACQNICEKEQQPQTEAPGESRKAARKVSKHLSQVVSWLKRLLPGCECAWGGRAGRARRVE